MKRAANNDMADPEDEESWYSMFTASGYFTDVKTQINGLGSIEAVQDIYVSHSKAAILAIAPAGETDEAAAARVAALIDAIYVQERTADTDAQCAAAKAAWDALTDAQKELVEGEEADPDYFGRNTGDAKADDPRNADGIGENELLVVSPRLVGAQSVHRADHHQPRAGARRRVHRQHGSGAGTRGRKRREEPRDPADASDARRGIRRALRGGRGVCGQVRDRHGRGTLARRSRRGRDGSQQRQGARCGRGGCGGGQRSGL